MRNAQVIILYQRGSFQAQQEQGHQPRMDTLLVALFKMLEEIVGHIQSVVMIVRLFLYAA